MVPVETEAAVLQTGTAVCQLGIFQGQKRPL